jgi:starvation-inducible outer membrane lipoprotein
MKLKKNNFYLLISLAAMLSGCTMKTTKVKNPEFIDLAKVQNELTNLIKAENFNLNGKEITTNKKTSTELEVSITNGQDIPAASDQQKALEKSIAVCIKKNLKNPNEFDSYKILLVKKTEGNGVKVQKFTGNTFKVSEL